MMVLNHEGRIIGLTRLDACLTDERVHVPMFIPIGDVDRYTEPERPAYDSRYLRLCHILAPNKKGRGHTMTYQLAAVILDRDDDPTILPGWEPFASPAGSSSLTS